MKILAFLGSMVGSSLGWWIGSLAGGTMMAFVVSIIGTGLGVYFGRRVAIQMGL